MKQLTIQYNGQLPKVETLKETATYKRKLAFLKKQIYDNQSAMNRTTDGNTFRRCEENLVYWEGLLEEFHIENTFVRELVEIDQSDFIRDITPERNPDAETCYYCRARGEYTKQKAWNSTEPDVWVTCEHCNGLGFTNTTPEALYQERVGDI
jgi:hypothetical protein